MRIRFYLILVILLVACQDVKRPEKPQNLIPQETMVSLLTEVYLGNAARSINNKRIREQGVQLDSFVYARFSIDSLQFVKSNAYYAANLDLYNAIIDSVQKRLEAYKEIENKKKLEETEPNTPRYYWKFESHSSQFYSNGQVETIDAESFDSIYNKHDKFIMLIKHKRIKYVPEVYQQKMIRIDSSAKTSVFKFEK